MVLKYLQPFPPPAQLLNVADRASPPKQRKVIVETVEMEDPTKTLTLTGRGRIILLVRLMAEDLLMVMMIIHLMIITKKKIRKGRIENLRQARTTTPTMNLRKTMTHLILTKTVLATQGEILG
jgi:hypothetical protein